MKLLTLRIVSFCLLALCMAAARAADFPNKVVHFLVPFPAGAAADNATRVVTRKLAEYWAQPVIVENKAGIPAIQEGARAPADGHWLMLAAGSQMVTGPLMRKLPYDPTRDFIPIGLMLTSPPILTTHPSLGVKSVKELIDYLKKNPGKLNFSSSGIGSPNQLALEMFQAMTGTSMVHVPYKGGAPSVIELVGGHIQLGVNAIPSVLAHVNTGKLMALAVASNKRFSGLPNLPTIAEAGVPGFEYTIWYGIFAPAKTATVQVDQLSNDLQRAVRDPEVAKQLIAQGNEPAPTTSAELTRFMREDMARWTKLVKERGLKIDE